MDILVASVSPKLQDNSPPVNTKDLVKNAELNKLVENLTAEASSLDFLVKDQQGQQQDQGHCVATKQGKILFIKDFVSCNRYLPDDSADTELISCNGSSLVVKTSASQKPRPEAVNIAQWISANARIMKCMLDRGELNDINSLLAYLDFTEQIGEYLQIYTTSSVMLYDHRFREKQYKGECKWGIPDIHAINFYLTPNSRGVKQQGNQPAGGKKRSQIPPGPSSFTGRDGLGNPICRDYQTEAGCTRKACRFSHVCIVQGCGKAHPQCLHAAITTNQVPPPSNG